MEPTVAERWSLVAASIVLIIGMMYVAINSANDSSRRAKLARGISTTPGPTIPVNGGFALGKGEATPTPQPVSGGLPGIGQETSSSGGGSSSSGSGATSLDPGTSAPPKTGKYTYVTSNGTPITFVVEGRAGASGTRQREYFTDDKGQPAGESDQNTWWKGDSKVIEDGKYSGGGQATYCDWNPDLLQYPLPLNANSSWNVDSSCKVDLGPQGGGQGTLRSTGSSRVVGTERLQVGTKNVDCWVIEGSSTIVVSNATGQTIFTIQTTVKDWFAAKYGVSARVVTTFGSGGGGGQSESTTLQSVDPK